MTISSLSNTLSELNELCRFFLEAEAGLKQNRITDISGVDARVSKVCKTVEEAMPEQQREYLPLLTTLIDLLNGYEQSLRSLHAETEKQKAAQ
jgi:hypothetical protein